MQPDDARPLHSRWWAPSEGSQDNQLPGVFPHHLAPCRCHNDRLTKPYAVSATVTTRQRQMKYHPRFKMRLRSPQRPKRNIRPVRRKTQSHRIGNDTMKKYLGTILGHVPPACGSHLIGRSPSFYRPEYVV